MNKIRKKIFLFCLLCIFVLTGLTACSGEEGVEVNSANALARKLASDSAVKINISEDILLKEPIVVNGEKEIVGTGKIVSAIEDSEEKYMITVASGGKLTVGGSVSMDASGLMGGIHVQGGGTAVVQDKAVVMNASEETANALIEGSFEVKGGTLKDANGHNIYNKKETVISGGEIIGSGSKYAGVYNEGTLTQSGGSVTKAYNNISNISGSTFKFEGGTNTKSTRDGVFVAEGATMTATHKDATIEEAGGRGIFLQGTATIKVITVKSCGDTLIKVGQQGVLSLGNGILQEGNYHGVDNAGTMTMMGGNIQMNKNCGIVNTGTLKVTGGSIANNENKGILNKHDGTADVTSAMVNFTSNKTAIANEDKAVFDFSKAKIMMSTQTNIYCYDGTINLYDVSLNASTSNNIRVVDGVVNMKNVEVKGNSQKSNTSHHGMLLEGGVVNAENVTVSMTTGSGIRVKGGNFIGKNIVMHDINRVGVSMGKHDQLTEREGLVDIDGLEIQSTNYANVYNEGGGTVKVKNAKLAVAGSNSVRVNDGRMELTNVTVPGHKEGSKDNIHGIYMEGGELIAKNVTVNNTSGNALRNKNGKFYGTNIKLTNIKGQSAIWNLPLNDEAKDGIIEIDGLTIKDSFSKNITLDCGVTTIKNATLGKTGGNNIKMQNNAATLNLYNVKLEGQGEDAAANTHGIMVEGGNVFGENVQIENTNACGIRCKLGVVDLKNVTMTNLGQAAISNGKMVKNKIELGSGEVKIDGLTTSKVGTNNILLDAGTVDITNAVLGKIETKNHNVKVTGTGVLTLDNVKVAGTSDAGRYGIIAEGGDAVLNNVEIYDLAKSAIHANKATSSVVGTNITIKDAAFGITGSNGEVELKDVKMSNISTFGIDVSGGKFTIDGLTTSDIGQKNALAGGKVKLTIINGDLCATPKHNTHSNGADSLLTLKDVTIKGVTSSGQYGVIAEKGGDVALEGVTIENVQANALHINNADSKITGSDVTISNANIGINATHGKVNLTAVDVSDVAIAVNIANEKNDVDTELEITGFTTSDIREKNVVAGGTSKVTIIDGDLSATAKHNSHSNGTDSILTLENVTIKGVTSSGQYGIIAEKGGDVALKDVTIENVQANALHINNANSKITGSDVTISNASIGINATHGKVNLTTVDVSDVAIAVNIANEENNVDTELEITGFTTSDIREKNVVAGGTSKVTIIDGDLSATAKHNSHSNGTDSILTLENVTIKGVTSSGQYGIIAEKGGDVALKDVTIENVQANALHINNANSKITGSNVTISNANYGVNASDGVVELKTVNISGVTNAVNASGGSLEITGLTTENVKEKNIHVPEGTTQTSIKVEDATLCKTTSGHNVHAKRAEATITLINVKVQGTGSTAHHAVMAEGGDFVLNNVEISGATAKDDRAAIRMNNASSEITGSDVTITDAKLGISATAGSVNLDEYKSNAVGQNIKASGSASITLSNAVFGKTPLHNIEVSGGTLTLNNATVQGTTATSGTVNGIKITGADTVVNATGLTVQETLSAGIRLSNGTFDGENVTLKDVTSHGIQVDSGKVIINGLTATGLQNAAVNAYGSAEVTVSNANVTGGTRAIQNVGSSKAVKVENLEATGQSEYGIFNTGELYIGGVIKASVYNDAAVTVKASSSLKGSVFSIDWAEGMIPTDLVAIEFANPEDMDATKAESTITFGPNANVGYVPYFYGAKLSLNDRNNIQYTVNNFAELKDRMSEVNSHEEINTVTITVTGNIIVTEEILVKTGKTVRIQDDETARTIKRAAEYTKGDLFEVETGATLEFSASSDDNSAPTLKIDGGSKNETPIITEPDSSFVRNNGILTVGSGVQLANAKGSEEYCKALAIYAAEGSTTTFNGVMKSIVGQYVAPQGSYGYGIAITVGKVQDFVIENAIIKDNYTPEIGIIRLEAGGKLTIKNSTFENNESVKEAGVISDSGNANNRLAIEGSTFKNNKTSGNGGVLVVNCSTQGNIVITDTTFTSNEAKEGGAITIAGSGAVTLDSCTFKNNVAKKATNDDVTAHWGKDVRVGGAGGKVTLKGKMDVTIFNRNKSVLTVSDNLEEGSRVVVDWSLDNKLPSDNIGIIFGSADIMNASKAYISLGEMQSTEYEIKFANATGTLVKPTEVANETQLKDAITAISETSDKIGFIKVTENFTISDTITIPEGVNVTILDDGTARTITRATACRNKTIFYVGSGATFALTSTSKDNSNPTLTVDGGSASIENSNAASLISNYGIANIGKGVLLTNNKSTGNNQGFGIYSQSGSVTTFSGVISNIVGTNASVKGNVFVIKGTFTMNGAVVKDCTAVQKGVIRVQGGQLTAIDSTFKNNTTSGSGSVLYLGNDTGSTITIDGCTFTENTSTGNGGVISIENKFDANIIRNSKFTNNTSGGEGGAISMATGAFLTLESCEFTGNVANKVSAVDSISGFGDVRVADNTSEGAIRISGKMVVDIYLNQAGKITVNGALTEGSKVIANWRIANPKKITADTFTGINFANAEVMEGSKDYFELSNNYSDTYELTFSGTNGILKKK